MRIAYVVDVHDRFEAVGHALAELGPVDVLVVGGDITTFGTPYDAEEAIELWRPLAPHLFAVAGNCDSAAIDIRLVELGVSIDGRAVAVDGVAFTGVSAAPLSPLQTPHELPDDELGARAEWGLAAAREHPVRIFCPHAPPYGTECDRVRSGAHVGSPSLRALVERERPDVVLCGHIHESRAIDELAGTRIANPGPIAAGHYALVETGAGVSIRFD